MLLLTAYLASIISVFAFIAAFSSILKPFYRKLALLRFPVSVPYRFRSLPFAIPSLFIFILRRKPYRTEIDSRKARKQGVNPSNRRNGRMNDEDSVW